MEEVPLATPGRVHPGEPVDGIDREEPEGIDVRVAEGSQQLGVEVGVGDADTRRRGGHALATHALATHAAISRDHLGTPTEGEALVEERPEDREVFGSLDQRGLHRGAQGVAIDKVDVPHRRRRVEHLTERDVEIVVSQCGEQAKQHREGCHRCRGYRFRASR